MQQEGWQLIYLTLHVDVLQLQQGNTGIENSHSIIFIDEQRGMYNKFQYQHLYQKVLSNCRCFSKYYVIAFNFEKKYHQICFMTLSGRFYRIFHSLSVLILII